MKKRTGKILALLLSLTMMAGVMAGCGSEKTDGSADSTSTQAATGADTTGKKTFVFGDTTFNAENEESTIDPHSAYCGWACMRYGVGETLMKINDSMKLEPWIAEGYELVDNLTWKITLKDGVCFSNGKSCDAEAVKKCLEDLIAVHERAAGDLKIASMEADGLVLTIHTAEECPSLMNYLSEPYGCIIDVDEGVTDDGIVVGTGPYVATELVTDDHLKLVKNENYWEGNVNIDEITVRTISDGDTLALALQSGEINAAYGMAYASYPIFENDKFQFTSVQTSRSFYVQMNYASPVVADDAVREAIAMGIDKESFVKVLLNGYGYVATGAFPDTVAFGGSTLNAKTYDPEAAKAVLEEAGWTDSDGDGIREKDGQKLTIRWLTYPSRQELPLLAEAAQSTLKEIGIEVQINATADHNTICKDPAAWDVYVGANVNCGLGDPTNFFSTHCLDASTKNRGQYHSDELEELAVKLNSTFDVTERNQIAIEMQQQLLDDDAFVFCSFLKMSMISQANVTGLTAHACDYYELTADLDINEV
ncbi:ABC transporter substrate-binding protein [Laedolimicola ammoniilytica]|uniref:ABC transporter substrate-binding protein n=1 Tax=Laedolimicola ammoniilytica TaxID=2981771 RepID=A0ABT2S193_9FIRM|nr:ABC transporter substrate-binding protein [Laedolimicola ammoniilytica]MCU6698371.1 ABC transporter substrate-binding protein [Laedolimicola ammoniilytica]SCI78546.1 Nickel-binding periplasmic protein precursor [uncultured Clostridium sp.]